MKKDITVNLSIDGIEKILNNLQAIKDNQHRIIHRLSVEHNNLSRPFAYLDPKDREEAQALRKKDPLQYDYIISILKMFLG